MKIRRAKLADSDELCKLISLLGFKATNEDIISRMKLLEHSINDAIFVAVIENEIAGFISFHAWPRFYDWGNHGRISAIAVHEKFRRKGVGNALLKKAEKFGVENECARIEVTNYSHRVDAHQFYINSGYIKVKSKRFIKACLEDID